MTENSSEKPILQYMQEGADGYTIYNDMRDPNGNRDPYAPSRDIVYSMKFILQQLLNDLLTENNSPTVNDVAGESGFSNHRLLEGYNSLIDTINSFVSKNRPRPDLTVDEAAKENGYAQLEPQLKLIMEAALGRLFIAMFFYAARSLTPLGSGAPAGDIGYNKSFDFIAKEVTQALDGVETPYARKLKNARKEKD